MKNIVLGSLLVCLAASTAVAEKIDIASPNNVLQLTFALQDGVPTYSLRRGETPIIETSPLGFVLKDGPRLDGGFQLADQATEVVDRSWEQVWGEQKVIRDHHRALHVKLKGDDATTGALEITFRLFDDGLGFRYTVPAQPGVDDFLIMDEKTGFHLTDDHRTWWIAAYQWNRYEYRYNDSPLSEIEVAHTPATCKVADDLYISFHEAALTDFASMTLKRTEGNRFEADLVPWSDGVKVRGTAPMHSPWRTIQVAKTPGGLIESYLILNLNEPNKLKDTSWIEPGKYVGIWWEMHLNVATWGSGEKHGATTANTKRYIDFAAKHGFDGVLVEGWNVGWDGNWIENGDKFNFTTPYPDFDLRNLAAYALERGVRLIGHHETGGGIENYERQMEDAFKLYQELGYRAVKTGYVAHGQELVRTDADGQKHNEWHHGQYMVRHYRKAVETAAKYQIVLDVHEPIKATGIRRTWPNMMTREGACGQEFNAWGGDNRNYPDHTTILPFTRMLGGPMDFTPGIFDLLFEEARPNNRVSTTLTKQLALYVVLYSPLHMAADLPQNYEARPKPFQFIKDVPTDWSETRVLGGAIGDHVTIARKHDDDWFIGSITDENGRTVEYEMSFLDADKRYVATIYRDGPDADWDTNPYAFEIVEQPLKRGDKLTLKLAPGGGTAIRIQPR